MFTIESLHSTEIQQIAHDYRSGKGISIQTSGSTGKPKMYHFTSDELRASAKRTNAFFDLNEQTKALLCISHRTIGGAMMVIRAIEGNFHLRSIPPTGNPLKGNTDQYDFVAFAPNQLVQSLQFNAQKLKQIRTLLIGGGPILESTCQQLQKEMITVWHSYGMTETCSHIALRKAGYQNESTYQCLEGIEVQQQNGRLGIDMGDRMVWTNDLVELKTNKEFTWLGRADFTINSGGIKIQIEDLEKKLTSLFPFPFCIWKEEDETLGEKLVMLSEVKFEVSKEKLLTLLSKYEIPKQVYLVSEILKSELGKPLRQPTYESKIIGTLEAIL